MLTLQKPAGTDEPKAVPQSDPKLPPPINPGSTDPKTDRDPPQAIATRNGQTNKDDLFRMDNEGDLLRRITGQLMAEERERLRRNTTEKSDERREVDPTYFAPPKVDPLVTNGTTYQPKTLSYPPGQTLLEPGYVLHRRLFFEELNSERYGWEVGIHQPAISTLIFWKDTVLYPAKLASNCGEWYDASAGKCLPGSAVPYKWYPEQVDAFGLLVGTGTILGTSAILGGF